MYAGFLGWDVAVAANGGVAKPVAAIGDDGAAGPVARGTAKPVGGRVEAPAACALLN